MYSRRAFLGRVLGATVAPLVITPTLEEIDRLTWRRRYFPGWTSPEQRLAQVIAKEILEHLAPNFVMANLVNRRYDLVYAGLKHDTLDIRVNPPLDAQLHQKIKNSVNQEFRTILDLPKLVNPFAH